mgnify:CR=1 FL=1
MRRFITLETRDLALDYGNWLIEVASGKEIRIFFNNKKKEAYQIGLNLFTDGTFLVHEDEETQKRNRLG